MSVKTVQAIINGQTYTLAKNSTTGKYEATITAPSKSSYGQSGHYYGVQVKAMDDAGNMTSKDASDATLGSSLQLRVKEKAVPSITITAPTDTATIITNKPTVTWTVTDADSGVNAETISLAIDSGSAIASGITKTEIADGYMCSYTPTTALADGSHTIKMSASDNDGNVATQKSVTFKIDTVPPTLSITRPTNGLVTNAASCTVTGTTNDIVSSPVTVTIKLNNGIAEKVEVNTDGTFNKLLTLANGNNTITVRAMDGAGKETVVTRNVELDTAAPVIKSVVLAPNPVDAGKTFVITIDVTD